MGSHIINGKFQSDKYPTTPPGKVPLSTSDPMAQDLLWEYAQRRHAVDQEFSLDLVRCLQVDGFEPTACNCRQTLTQDPTRHFRGCLLREKYPDHPAAHEPELPAIDVPSKLEDATLTGLGRTDLVRMVRGLETRRDEALKVCAIYRDTCKNAQEAGTRKHEELVRARNLLRVAQPYLELDPDRHVGDPELSALCQEIEKEVGPMDSEKDGASVAERLGIDIDAWAEEMRAKVDAYSSADKRKLVVLCGSTRFAEAFANANLEETLKGHVVLSVGSMTHSDGRVLTAAAKEELDRLHLDKITMADEVLVLNAKACVHCGLPGAANRTPDERERWTKEHPCSSPHDFQTYIGDSTRNEIEHAKSLGKPIRYLEPT